MLRELALFAGAGGGLLASQRLGWTTAAAVEKDQFARTVLFARQRDGKLRDRFPIWDDIHTFDGLPWRGRIDVISGGFPCQPFSTASRGRACAKDLWPEMLRIVREVEPRLVFAENVQRAPIHRAAEDLAALGYVVRCARVGSRDVDAPHARRRYWLVADADHEGQCAIPEYAEVARVQTAAGLGWRSPPPAEVLGVDDGMASRVDRMRCIGNGQSPQVADLAWKLLYRGSKC